MTRRSCVSPTAYGEAMLRGGHQASSWQPGRPKNVRSGTGRCQRRVSVTIPPPRNRSVMARAAAPCIEESRPRRGRSLLDPAGGARAARMLARGSAAAKIFNCRARATVTIVLTEGCTIQRLAIGFPPPGFGCCQRVPEWQIDLIPLISYCRNHRRIRLISDF